MPVLTTETFTALALQTRATFTNMHEVVGDVPERLYAEAGRLGLTIAGPMVFLYDDVTGDKAKEFGLLLALPITAEGAVPAGFVYRHIEPFSCASYTHTGPWEDLEAVYNAIFPAFHAQGHTYNKQVREVYAVVDFENTNNHVTEIQVGIGA